jgi:Ni/Fe-hydrogenase subunit HybB-like protein
MFESMIASKSFGRKPEMHVLTPLAKFTPYLLGIYITFRIGDMVYRGSYVHLFEGSPASIIFWIEFGLLTVVPFFLFATPEVRRSPQWLFTAAIMYIVGVLLNRCAVFFIAYKPPYATEAYFPSLGEIALTVGLIAALMLTYRLFVTLFPVLPVEEKHEA